MDDPILSKLLEDTYSLNSLKKKVRALKDSLTEEFFGAGDHDKLALDDEDKEWLKSLPEEYLKQFKKEEFNEIFRKLEKDIESLNPLTVYLAFDPEAGQVKEIGEFIRNNFSKDMLIDIKLDGSLIGGCALIWKGVYKDYSLKAHLQEKKPEILNSFKSYLKS